MSLTGLQKRELEAFIKNLAHTGLLRDEWAAVDHYCRERKRIMRRQRSRRRRRRGWS